MSIIATTIEALELGEPLVHHNLAVFPLRGGHPGRPPYDTLKEALDAGTVTIAEVSEGGSVPRLALDNRGVRPVLVIDGEELVGAKQNRVLNLTILAPAGKSIVIPVSCVEQGRWGYRSRHFEDHDRVLFSKARAAKAARVSECKEHRGENEADQGQVWDMISAKMGSMRVESPSMAMEDIYTKNAPRLEEYVAAFRPLEGQAGAVFCVNGRIENIELFAWTDTLARLLPKLVRGCAIDALEEFRAEAPAPARPEVEALLRRVAGATATSFPAVGLGEDLRLQAPGLSGGALAADGAMLHLCAFNLPEEENRQPANDGGTIRRHRPGWRPPMI
jgi:hypothetical protein